MSESHVIVLSNCAYFFSDLDGVPYRQHPNGANKKGQPPENAKPAGQSSCSQIRRGTGQNENAGSSGSNEPPNQPLISQRELEGRYVNM